MQQGGHRPVPGVWRFGQAELHETDGHLRVAGSARALDRSSLQVLRHLLRHAGEVVTKDELLEAGWPGRVVAENSLAKAVSRLRAALDGAAEVRAVHGYGYRLACPTRFEPSGAPAPVPSTALPAAGQTLPGEAAWTLLRRLGEGSTGVTFLAHSPTHGERVLKLARDEAGLRGLRREIALSRYIAQALPGQDCVAPVLGWNLEEPPCWLELPYFPGGNLHDWIRARGGLATLDEATRLALCVALCEAVAAIHDLGIIHRDLKPENLYPVEADGRLRVVLADLGAGEAVLSPQLEGIAPTLGLTMGAAAPHSPAAGSLLYIAPEVVAGEAATLRSDVYALGVLVFQLLGGDLRGALGPGWEARIADPLLREDIALAAAIDPQQRSLDARSLAARLRGLEPRRAARRQAREQALQARLQAWRRRRELRRRRLGAGLTAVLGVALLATGAMYLKTEQRRQQAETATAQREAMLAFVTGDILGQADPYDSRSSGAAGGGIRAAVDRAAARVDARLHGDPLAAAAVHGMLGNIYFAQDAHDRAITHLEKARTYALASGAGDPAGLVQVETTLCDVHRIGGHLAQAEEACASALEHARRAGPGARHLATLKLGQLRSEQGRHQESRQLLQPLLEQDTLGTDPRLRGELHWALGLSARALGDYVAAREHFGQLLQVAKAMGEDSSWLGWAYNSLGSVLVETGEYERADALLQRAHEVFARTQGEEQIETQMPDAWRAEIRLLRGQWDEASAILQRIRQAWQDRLPPEHAQQQRIAASLAWADAMAGRTEQARAALAAVPRRNDPAQARARSSAWRTLRWSRVALALDELERAGELLDLFEEELAQELPDPHPLRGETRCLRSEWARRRGDAALAVEGAAACRDSLARYYAPGDPRLQHLEATRAAFAAAP
ncbi:tetratricopeptide repeat protein [Pseudoxanthomonas sp. SGT-18]|uniref:tetratricopeptide repeat protein n=1 Tax=Pseudoxanthomonas sp. SGT-18 TaxID=2493087 RepID=UPI000F628C6E|nr:tetratricopeptide repeat protein [Pseudoxanthomonas sp. SGT-18]